MNLNRYVFVTMSLLLIVVPYALGHVTGANLQNFQYNADFVSVAPIVDGYLDDPIWEKVIPGKLNQDLISGKRLPESPDFSGSFAAVLA